MILPKISDPNVIKIILLEPSFTWDGNHAYKLHRAYHNAYCLV